MEDKKPQPSQPSPRAETKVPTAAEVLSLLKQLPEKERSTLRNIGVQIPMVAEGADPTKKVYSYLCRNCGELGLDFLGDAWDITAPDGSKTRIDEIPVAVPFDRLPTTQECDDPRAIHRSKHPRRPQCRYCGNELARGTNGGIVPKGYVVIREPWLRAVAAEKASRRIRIRSFERENPNLFAHNVRGTNRLYESASQPIIQSQSLAKP